MSAPTTTRRQLLNPQLFFIPYGESVSSTPVTATAWPVHTTLTAWNPYEIIDPENVKDVRSVMEEKFMLPNPLGGYWEDVERMLTGLGFEVETHKSSSYIEQLVFATPTAPVVAASQQLAANTAQQVKGVLLMFYRIKNGGTQTHSVKAEVIMSLKTIPQAEAKTNLYGLSFAVMPNALNSFTVLA